MRERKVQWFLVDPKGEIWAPFSGTYESLKAGKEAQAKMNLTPYGPFKLYEKVTEVYEVG